MIHKLLPETVKLKIFKEDSDKIPACQLFPVSQAKLLNGTALKTGTYFFN